MPVRRTLDQERAAAAWEAVQAVTKLEVDVKKDYRALARGFGAMIQINGLGPSCAFLYAKWRKNDGISPHALLLDHLESWLCPRLKTIKEQQKLTDWLMTTCTREEYRWTTVEVIAYLLWLRRFAEGALPPEDAGKGTAAGATAGREHA